MLTIKKNDIVNSMPRYILIAIIVIAVLAAGWYFYSNKTGGGAMPYQQDNPNGSIGDKMSGKIADLLKAGKNLECTFSGETDGYKTSGTVFVSGNNMRGDFNSEAQGKMMDSHMIQNGETIYTWTTDPKQGMMMKISKEDQAKYADDEATAKSQSFNMDQSYDYNCRGWSGDQSKFQAPSDIQFTDLSAQLEKATGSLDKGNSAACSACDSLEDEAKTSCKTALNCQ